jgi:indole-3-glycerol phosphate synthase / phosphoribosylanthranilate isomerase
MVEQGNVLDKIVTHKQGELIQRKKANSYESLLHAVQVSDRSLEKALSQPGNRFILEYKRASPSKGVINAALTVDEICSAYLGFADAVSVLTDSRFFDGSFHYLRQARDKLSVPVLCKDFILEPYQVIEARYYGADAILLMLSVVNDCQYLECAAIARRFNMDILTEVHTEEEVSRAIRLGARIIGINNRDLNTLRTDISITEKLTQKIPSDRLIISESGISSRHDIARLSHRVDGFLIGTILTGSKDVRGAVKRLLFGEIKICGVKNWSDVRAADFSGASYVGLMCHEKSLRYLPIKEAERLTKAVQGKYVGVFVNASVNEIVDTVQRLSLYAVQCHGDETIAYMKELKNNLPTHCQLWKAIGYDEASIHLKIEKFETIVDRLLIDTMMSQTFGGCGQRFDWQAIGKIQELMKQPQKLILAGGINLENVCELEAHPELSLDISSGVESQPGIKSTDKIQQLFEQRRNFRHESTNECRETG